MRVLIINTSERIGGAAIAANRLMEALKKNGVKAKMLVRDKQTDHLTVVSVGSSWLLPLKFVWERFIIFIANMLSKKNLFQVDIANTGTDVTNLAEFERADVIHLHWVNQGFLSLDNINKIMHSGKPVVITMHDQWYFTGICHYSDCCDKYKQMCENCMLMKGKLLGDIAKKTFIRKQKIYSDAKLTFVGCSKWMADLAKESKLTQGHKVINIPNAINAELFHPMDKSAAKEEFGFPKDKRLILFSCQKITDERKGFKYFVEALNIIKEANPELASSIEIAVVGGKSDEVTKMVPFNIITVPYISEPEKMVALYNTMDIYVTPSLQDNLPNTIMESLACGIPCVGFNIGGIPEMIDHKQNGYVAEYKDAKDFANGIVWTLTQDYELLSSNACNKVIQEYCEEAVAKKYIEAYES